MYKIIKCCIRDYLTLKLFEPNGNAREAPMLGCAKTSTCLHLVLYIQIYEAFVEYEYAICVLLFTLIIDLFLSKN